MMNLVEALRTDASARLALVGAGGKSTALFQLAHQLPPPVLVTSTTHLGIDQIQLAGRHYFVNDSAGIDRVMEDPPQDVLLFTGPDSGSGRTLGIAPAALERLRVLAGTYKIPLLVEADGSRRRPLKAPAVHEPPIPDFINTVLVVAGLSGVGRPLGEEFVHRPEIFASLSGLELGSPVTVEALARVFTAAQGGLKNIPEGARRVALLNQADTPEMVDLAHRLVTLLLPAYQAVIIASLDAIREGKSSNEPGRVQSVHQKIAGIILAAGEARRFGSPKQVLPWEGVPLVRRAALVAIEAGLEPVVVVTGAHAEQVRPALDGLPVILAHNPDWKAGQSTSLQTGLHLLPSETGATVFLLADQPYVGVDLLQALVNVHAATLAPLVAPRVGERRANPVLFDRMAFPDLMTLQGDTGGRALFSEPYRYPVAWREWEDPAILFDIDAPQDYTGES